MSFEIRVLSESTRTSILAARALGCGVSDIAKSVVFVGAGAAVVVLPGDRRVETRRLGEHLGTRVRPATAEEVEEGTGYRIGGVPPFPHREGVKVVVDASLAGREAVWAAAGAPNAVFRISSADLARLAGDVQDVSVRQERI